jgi:hypothetical protein
VLVRKSQKAPPPLGLLEVSVTIIVRLVFSSSPMRLFAPTNLIV